MTMKHCGKHHHQQSNMYSKLVHSAYQTVSDSHYESKQTQEIYQQMWPAGGLQDIMADRDSWPHINLQWPMCPHFIMIHWYSNYIATLICNVCIWRSNVASTAVCP